VSHFFPYEYNQCSNVISGKGPSPDGSGYSFYGGSSVISPDGKSISPPVNTGGTGSGAITDANGNVINNNGSGTFTDTLGKSALIITGGGTQASPRVFTYNTLTGTAAVTLSYKTYSVQTNFGCSGISDYGSTTPVSNDLPYRITLADGSYYQFSYELTPKQAQGGTNVTGRLSSITLPTGGTISYTYTGGTNGINCADGSTTDITRTTSDGTRTYVRSAITTTSSQTTITDGVGNASTYNFVTAGSPAAFYETNRAIYQGSTSGAQLLSRQTCYNGSPAPCTTTAITTLPITQIDTYETLNGVEEHGSTLKYNTYGLMTEQDTYDFAGANSQGNLARPTTPMRKELWVYPSTGIVSLLSSDTVQDGSGNQISQTTYAYDETAGTGHAALTTTSGLPQHGGTVGTQRGNLTTLSQWVNTSGATVSATYSYEDTGQPLTSQGPE
jgi:hypothetical protein